MNDDYERPPSVPTEGMVPAFDAGWNAHKVGLSRESARILPPLSGRGWVLLGYDSRALIESKQGRASESYSC